MNDVLWFEVSIRLTSVQAEMLAKCTHIGVGNQMNMGWRKPEEWVELARIVVEALKFPRGHL